MGDDFQHKAFVHVFSAAYAKCFGVPLSQPISETDSRHFSNEIFETTGLVIGAKSLKNYSLFILEPADAKLENPSAATLDTLARYVLNAPMTDEVSRKENEKHLPYWMKYRSALASNQLKQARIASTISYRRYLLWLIPVVLLVWWWLTQAKHGSDIFIETFRSLDNDTLSSHGWILRQKDDTWWNKRASDLPGITLFTLRGDSWPDTTGAIGIRNLLTHRIESDCFTAELHMEHFIPEVNWQQAGLLLLEDTVLTSRCIRLSIAYNDFFGGYRRPGEILIQGIATGGKDQVKPEEIAHIPLFAAADMTADSIVGNNLRYAALRIEKKKDQFRILYSVSPVKNFAFKEAFSKTLQMKPRYIGIFALKGFVNDTINAPVHISFFSLAEEN